MPQWQVNAAEMLFGTWSSISDTVMKNKIQNDAPVSQ
jgi:hypothetical protein